MDIRRYFQTVRDIERNLVDPFAVVVSLETPEGGKPGCATEVSRSSAALLIAENKARLATADEQAKFYADAQEAYAAAEELKLAGKIQLTVVSEQQVRPTKAHLEKR